MPRSRDGRAEMMDPKGIVAMSLRFSLAKVREWAADLQDPKQVQGDFWTEFGFGQLHCARMSRVASAGCPGLMVGGEIVFVLPRSNGSRAKATA